MAQHPIFWTFRRCPYAMRARLALVSAGVRVELREILLRDKPEEFLQTSPTGTVPALRIEDQVLDESLDIMIWVLKQNDPQKLLKMPQEGWELISTNDGPFKTALDHTKYTTRYPELNTGKEREKAAAYLMHLDDQLAERSWLFGSNPTIADLAILPFVRQFAHIDRHWFDAQDWSSLSAWLDHFLDSQAFKQIMHKYSPWSVDDAPLWFGS